MSDDWTDEQVASLPIAQGRAELLEEIMSTPVLGQTDRDRPARSRPASRRWAVPLAAAAAVVALASTPLWWPGSDGPAPSGPATNVAPVPAPLTQMILEAPGWEVDNASGDLDEQEVSYFLGGDDEVRVDITRMPAQPGATIDDFVPDYRDVTTPESDGTPLDVAGLTGRTWAYNPQDRVVITEPTNGYWFEVRAGGGTEAEFEALLAQLRLVDQQGFEDSLPDSFVLPAERETAAAEILRGIADNGGGTVPQGTPLPSSTEIDGRQFGIDVAGQFACAWFARYVDATGSGDAAARAQAQEVLGTARAWPVLVELGPGDGYVDLLYDFVDRAVAGKTLGNLRNGLGCA